MSQGKPVFDLRAYGPNVADRVNNIDYDELPRVNDKSLKELRKEILRALDESDLDGPVDSLPEPLKDFIEACHQVFTKDVYHRIFLTWPPVMPNSEKTRNLTYFILSLIRDSTKAPEVLRFISNNCFELEKKDKPANKVILKAASVVKMDNDTCWAYYDTDGYARIDAIKDKKVMNVINTKVKSVKKGDGKLKFNVSDDETIECKLDNSTALESWSNIKTTPLPLFFSTFVAPVPKAVLSAFYEVINSDNCCVNSTLVDPSAIKVKDSVVAEELFKVSCYGGRANSFLSTIIQQEFSQPDLTPQKVLRQNSHFSNLLKYFVKNHSGIYITNFLSKIIKKILEDGNIGLKNLENVDGKKFRKLLYTVLNYILRSAPAVSNEMRNIASHLFYAAAYRFNNMDAILNTLSGFFCLRFITPVISDPTTYLPDLNVEQDQIINILVPFSQILQQVLSFNTIEGDFKFIKSINKELSDKFFPRLKTFLLSLTEFHELNFTLKDEVDHNHCKRAVDHTAHEINGNYESFSKRYKQLIKGKVTPAPIASNFAIFFMGFFKYHPES